MGCGSVVEIVVDRAGVRVATGGAAAQFVLHCDPADAPALAGRLDVALPAAMLRVERTGGWRALHLAPDEWLLVGPPGGAAALAARVDGAPEPHSLVDVGERTQHLLVEGPAAPALLATACPLDFDGSAFPPGAATRTLFGKVTIMLERDTDCFRMHYGRSFAEHMAALVRTAALDLPGMGPS